MGPTGDGVAGSVLFAEVLQLPNGMSKVLHFPPAPRGIRLLTKDYRDAAS